MKIVPISALTPSESSNNISFSAKFPELSRLFKSSKPPELPKERVRTINDEVFQYVNEHHPTRWITPLDIKRYAIVTTTGGIFKMIWDLVLSSHLALHNPALNAMPAMNTHFTPMKLAVDTFITLSGVCVSTLMHLKLREHARTLAKQLKDKGFNQEERILGLKRYFFEQATAIEKKFVDRPRTIKKLAGE